MAHGAAPIPVNVAEEAPDGFGPLQALLGAIPALDANFEVRLRLLLKIIL